MRLACPECAAEYEVPADRLKPGKPVRCARCGNKWSPVQQPEEFVLPAAAAGRPELDADLDMAAAVPKVTAMDRLAASPAPIPARRGLTGAWVLTLVVLAAALAAAIGWRETIVRAWPPSGRLLATTGNMTPKPAQNAGKNAQ
jgi:predicted Zn finger-like uncharacterized protein